MERFIKNCLILGGYFDKSAKALAADQLPGLVRGKKFQYRMVFVSDPEAGNSLAPVDIKRPHRYAIPAGYPGEEVGERLGVVIVFNNEFSGLIQVIFGFFALGFHIRLF
jgi:hypothetical protein